MTRGFQMQAIYRAGHKVPIFSTMATVPNPGGNEWV